MCWCGSFKYIPLSYWVYSICKVSLFQWMSSVAMKSSSLNKWSGVTVWTDWACSVKTLWSGGPTEGATRSRDRRGECACGEREGKEEQSVRHISRSLRPPPSLSLSVFVCLSLSLTHSLSDAFLFSMEAMRRKQVWCFLEAHKGKDMLALYSSSLVGCE